MNKKEPRCNCTVKGTKEYNRLNEMEIFLSVLSDRTRLKMLCLLKSEEMNVKSIYEEIGIKQTLASHHLAQLKKLGLLKERKAGTACYYRVDAKRFEKYCVLMVDMVELNLKTKKC